MNLEKITSNVYAVTDGINGGNMGAIVFNNEVVVIDSGMAHTLSIEVANELRLLGSSLNYLVFTHYHSDHIMGAQAFDPIKRVSSKPTKRNIENMIESRIETGELRKNWESVKDSRPNLWQSLQTLEVVIPEIVFEDKMIIDSSEDVIVRHLGGHTDGSSVVTCDSESVVFVGDLIFNEQFPYAGDPTTNPDDWIEAMHYLRQLGQEIVIPGHGQVGTQDTIEEYIEFLTSFKGSITTAISEHLSPQEYLEQKLYPDFYTMGSEKWIELSVKHWFSFYGETHK
ncbi:MAG: hypothetical protein BAJATHORv1_40301 [Candidatus Thorarchaeota archaeon]|nr:MAG: hypothetical protein BAJATHORv1_40301 [Candidatus Thorarchaeota archaeon]